MSVREFMYDRANLILLVGPLADDVVRALPAAIADHILSSEGSELRRRHTDGQRWSHPSSRAVTALLPDVLMMDEPGLDPAEIAVRVAEAGYRGLPISVHMSGAHAAFMLPHDLFDGIAAWKHINAIFTRATGAQPKPPRGRPLRFPVAATLRNQNLVSASRVKEIQRLRKASEEAAATGPQFPDGIVIDRLRRLSGLSYVRLSHDDLQRFKASWSGVPGGARLYFRLAELVVRALEAAAPPDLDFPLRMMVDVRRYAPHGARITGPFASDIPLGTLRTGDNSAAALAERVDRFVDAKVPLTGFTLDLAYLSTRRLRHPFRSPERRTRIHQAPIMLSILPCQMPAKSWASEGDRLCAGLGMHPDYVATPYVQICRMNDGVHVTLWDELGCFEKGAFESVIRGAMSDDDNAPRQASAAERGSKEGLGDGPKVDLGDGPKVDLGDGPKDVPERGSSNPVLVPERV